MPIEYDDIIMNSRDNVTNLRKISQLDELNVESNIIDSSYLLLTSNNKNYKISTKDLIDKLSNDIISKCDLALSYNINELRSLLESNNTIIDDKIYEKIEELNSFLRRFIMAKIDVAQSEMSLLLESNYYNKNSVDKKIEDINYIKDELLVNDDIKFNQSRIDKLEQDVNDLKNSSGGNTPKPDTPNPPSPPVKQLWHYMWIVDGDHLDSIISENNEIKQTSIDNKLYVNTNTSYPFVKNKTYNSYSTIISKFYNNDNNIDLSNKDLYLIIPCKGPYDPAVYVDTGSGWLNINGMTLQTIFPFVITNQYTKYGIVHHTKYISSDESLQTPIDVQYACFHIANDINSGQNLRIN